MDMYVYTPLPDSNQPAARGRYIRVFDIRPSLDPDSPIEGALRVQKLTDGGYYAISYAWGPISEDGSHLTRRIVCNGRVLKATESLYTGLRRIREQCYDVELSMCAAQSNGTLSVWADAICIDQSNLNERGHQVRIMDKVYWHSSRVIVWLGDDLDETDHAAAKITLEGRLLALSLYGDHPGVNHALRLIASRAWFKRRWVVQEYFHGTRFQFQTSQSRRLMILLGPYVISNAMFETIQWALEFSRRGSRGDSNALSGPCQYPTK